MIPHWLKSLRRRQSDRRPRLLLVSPLPPPAGGIATWTRRLLSTELYGRYQVEVLNTNTGRADGQVLGLTPRKAGLAASFIAKFSALMLSYRPDIVHINTSGFLPLMLIEAVQLVIGRHSGAVVLMHIRGSVEDVHERSRPPMRKVQGLIFRRADRVLTLHETGLQILANWGVDGRQISNFVMERPAPDRSDRSGPVQVLFVGWIMPFKGVLELIDAVRQIPGVHLTLLGRVVHDAGEEIEAAIEAAGIRDRLSMPGEVPMSEVWDYYDTADIFALPSWTEGFPNTLVEAMMSALPAIYTDVGAMPEMQIPGETGLQIPVRDVPALKDALQQLVEDRPLRLRMGQAARARALAEYEMSQVIHRLLDHYDELLGTDTRSRSA